MSVRQTESQSDRQTESQTDRQTVKKPESQTVRKAGQLKSIVIKIKVFQNVNMSECQKELVLVILKSILVQWRPIVDRAICSTSNGSTAV